MEDAEGGGSRRSGGGEGGEGGREDKGREGEGRGVKKGEGGPPVPTGNTETIIFHTPANQQHPCRQASRAVGSADSINQSMSPCAGACVRHHLRDTYTVRGVTSTSDNLQGCEEGK